MQVLVHRHAARVGDAVSGDQDIGCEGTECEDSVACPHCGAHQIEPGDIDRLMHNYNKEPGPFTCIGCGALFEIDAIEVDFVVVTRKATP